MSSLVDQVISGERKAVSKAITAVENKEDNYSQILQRLYPHTGTAHIVGITGPPGTGKSSIVDGLVKIYRTSGKRIAVLAVDPSSPISGGAILGDRVRMLEHSLDSGVYIRSMASRGDERGLSAAAMDAVIVLDAAGFDIVFVETVGIGQTEVEIVELADTVVAVLMPELGDEIQAAKAGLMEIGDIFAINKSDLPGADKVIYNLHPVLSSKEGGWKQIALKVSAKTGQGMSELAKAISDHGTFIRTSGVKETIMRERLKQDLIEKILEGFANHLKGELLSDPDFEMTLDLLVKKEIDPDSAANRLLKKYDFARKRAVVSGKEA